MSDGYGVDLTAMSLEALQQTLAEGDLLPSHRPLRENLAAHFEQLRAQGYASVQDVVEALRTKTTLARVSHQTGIPLEYLTLLRRHVNGYIPAPVQLAAIPDLDPTLVARLAKLGIRHTKHLFERARTRAARDALAAEIDASAEAMTELVQLADLGRVGWVGPIGVRLFHAAGVHTAAELAAADPDAFLAQMQAVNRERAYTKVSLGRKDVVLVISTAQRLPEVVEW